MDMEPLDSEIIIDNQRFSADLNNVPLRKVVEEISEQGNIRFEVDESVIEEKISVRFRDLSITKGLKRILNGLNHIILYNGEKEVTDLIILGKEAAGQDSRRNTNTTQIFKGEMKNASQPSPPAVSEQKQVKVTGAHLVEPRNIPKALSPEKENIRSGQRPGIPSGMESPVKAGKNP